jgi:hypothetical protein
MNTSKKKLAVAKETLQVLKTRQLEQAGGGSYNPKVIGKATPTLGLQCDPCPNTVH